MSLLIGPADITCMLGIRTLNVCSQKKVEVHQAMILASGNMRRKEERVGSGLGEKHIECFFCRHRNIDECDFGERQDQGV